MPTQGLHTNAGPEVRPALRDTGPAVAGRGGRKAESGDGQGWDRLAPAVAPSPALTEGNQVTIERRFLKVCVLQTVWTGRHPVEPGGRWAREVSRAPGRKEALRASQT